MSKPTSLSSGKEFDLIRTAFSRLGDRIEGAGDDAAVFSVGRERCVISTDMSVENTHFRMGWMAPDELGFRCAMASLSDLAAMAAEPLGVVAGVGVSPDLPDDFLGEVMGGIGEAAADVGAHVWGGDTVRAEHLTINVTVVGHASGEPLLRSGVDVGDQLLVTGKLGGPASALAAWTDGREPSETARARFVRPEARIREALWLRDHGAKAMIDVSDGLVADAAHLSAASRVECVIELENVPRHDSCETVHAAAVSGEEYEILIAIPGDADGFVDRFGKEFDLELTRVGRVQKGSGVRVEHHGQAVSNLAVFRHF